MNCSLLLFFLTVQVLLTSSSAAYSPFLSKVPSVALLQSFDHGLPSQCAPLCWQENIPSVGLNIFYRLNGCFQFNITTQWGDEPASWSLVSLEVKGPSYAYKNYWTDFALGDEAYAYQSRRERWLWDLSMTELIFTRISHMDSNQLTGMENFDSFVVSSTIYRLFNDTHIVAEEAILEQNIPYKGPATHSTSSATNYFPKLTVGCRNDVS